MKRENMTDEEKLAISGLIVDASVTDREEEAIEEPQVPEEKDGKIFRK